VVRRKTFLVVVASILLVSLTFGSLIDEIKERGVLRVGQDAGYMPLYGTDMYGNRIGLEVDVLRIMATLLGVRLEFVVVNWDGIIPALLSEKFDIIWSGMTITEERAKKVDFSEPYLEIGQVLVYNNIKISSVPSLEELNDPSVRIAVQLGTTGDEAARRLFPRAKILTFDSMDEAAFQVASGRADFTVVDSIYAQYVAKKYDRLSVADGFLTSEELGVAIRKNDPETLNWINNFIKGLKSSGFMEHSGEKWFVEYEPEL